jgi:hypothetical protein
MERFDLEKVNNSERETTSRVNAVQKGLKDDSVVNTQRVRENVDELELRLCNALQTLLKVSILIPRATKIQKSMFKQKRMT